MTKEEIILLENKLEQKRLSNVANLQQNKGDLWRAFLNELLTGDFDQHDIYSLKTHNFGPYHNLQFEGEHELEFSYSNSYWIATHRRIETITLKTQQALDYILDTPDLEIYWFKIKIDIHL